MSLSANNIIELLCLVCSFIFLKNEKNKIWKFQILYLVLVCLIELVGRYYRVVIQLNNSWVYNIYLLAEIGFISTVFYNFFKSFIQGRMFVLLGVAVFMGTYINEIFSHGFSEFNIHSDILLSVFFCICSLLYYYQLLQGDKYEVLSKSPDFWWVNGVLFFYFGSIACDLFFAQLMKLYGLHLRSEIYIILNLLLYGSWAYAYLCRYHIRKQLT